MPLPIYFVYNSGLFYNYKNSLKCLFIIQNTKLLKMNELASFFYQKRRFNKNYNRVLLVNSGFSIRNIILMIH
jgi:hypothetical protein